MVNMTISLGSPIFKGRLALSFTVVTWEGLMNNPEDRTSQSRYSEDEVRHILRKAIELNDVRRTTLDENDLIAIAGELGIGPDVVRDAIVESRQLRSPRLRNSLSHRIEGAVLAGFAAVTFVPVAIWDSNALPSIITVGATSVVLALDSDEPGPVRRYLSRNAWLWGGFWAAGATQFYMTPDVALMLTMGLPVAGGLAGMSLIKLLRRLRPSSRPQGGRVPLVTRVGNSLLRLLPGGQNEGRIERVAAHIVVRLAAT
jgi:hypothetical protein